MSSYPAFDMTDHVRESNLIEGIDDPMEDIQSLQAWHYISTKKNIGLKELLEMHRRITTNQLNAIQAGCFRRVDVMVGGYLAPPAHLSEQLVYNLLMDLIQRPEELDPKEAHIRFEKAHPFIDGNGRAGRMLMWWHELKIGREPTLIPDVDKEDYYKWFREV